MIRYKCVVSYDGSLYCGWQSQTNGNSVQEHIEHAILMITHQKTNILAAGRTDAGVNAWGQVFHFDSEKEMSGRKWVGALNTFLPDSIRIRSVEQVDEHFHARYCVLRKQYDYRINLSEYNVFTRNCVWQCPFPIDVEKMERAAQCLIGTHDFTSYNSNSLSETPDQVRTIESIQFHVDDMNVLTISLRGRGFLRYMVRMIVGQLVAVGAGRLKEEDIKRILDAKSKTAASKKAPAEGLTLQEVEYFKIVAENEELVLRDVLPEDGEREKAVYVLADRHQDIVYGALLEDGCLVLQRPVPEAFLQDLLKQYSVVQIVRNVR